MLEVIEKELVFVERDIVIENESKKASDRIFNKLKEIIDFPEGIQELTIKLSVGKPPLIDIKHIIFSETNQTINTILTIRNK